MNRLQLASHLRDVGNRLALHARTTAAERAAMRRDPMIPPAGLSQMLFQHATAAGAKRRAIADQGREAIAAYRGANVLTTPPSFAPETAARASYIAAWTALLPTLSPHELIAELRRASAGEERDKLALAAPYGRSVLEYRKPFVNDTRLAGALSDAEQTLAAAPEVVASEEASALADQAEHEVGYMERLVAGDNALETLEVHQRLGALPNLLPLAGDQ